ncbi:hypothetical protein LEAN103870_03370 [Legionella anisa]|uniref:Uncharacterized protein n=1 Tax=Legionella anisa TaxID=28082 RepID=A0AAX0WXU0_9GAMM|nr:hypothetical protein DLD14_01985 [Legionella anisa]KTC72955.1 hypothetical protein Lani_1179 [Legionella anisa]PNL63163.1 hypothetical protein A6J39_019275 [Legionella anisa]
MSDTCLCTNEKPCPPISHTRSEDSISKVIQIFGRYYVHIIIIVEQGTLWENRYKASLIDSEQNRWKMET